MRDNGVLVDMQTVVKDYEGPTGPIHVLERVDLQVGEGEFVGIRGPSGSGKSTLLNCPNARVEQLQDDGPITPGRRPAHAKAASSFGLGPQGDLTSVEERLYFSASERLDGRRHSTYRVPELSDVPRNGRTEAVRTKLGRIERAPSRVLSFR